MTLTVPHPTDADEYVDVDLAHVDRRRYDRIERTLIEEMGTPGVKGREAIHTAFVLALQLCPDANPTDLWVHVIYRTYLEHARARSPEQSWARASGDAFELFLQERYHPIIEPHGYRLTALFSKNEKLATFDRLGTAVSDEVTTDKIDLTIEKEGTGLGLRDGYGIVGVVHAKTSLAERMKDDAPASVVLMREGLESLFITLDAKAFPPPHGDWVARGEFGSPLEPTVKRDYVERFGEFSIAFSYNHRTYPSQQPTTSGRRIDVVDVRDRVDAVASYILQI